MQLTVRENNHTVLCKKRCPGKEKGMGRVMAVCISEKRGTQKKNIHEARLVEDFGIEGDAHAGHWHR